MRVAHLTDWKITAVQINREIYADEYGYNFLQRTRLPCCWVDLELRMKSFHREAWPQFLSLPARHQTWLPRVHLPWDCNACREVDNECIQAHFASVSLFAKRKNNNGADQMLQRKALKRILVFQLLVGGNCSGRLLKWKETRETCAQHIQSKAKWNPKLRASCRQLRCRPKAGVDYLPDTIELVILRDKTWSKQQRRRLAPWVAPWICRHKVVKAAAMSHLSWNLFSGLVTSVHLYSKRQEQSTVAMTWKKQKWV